MLESWTRIVDSPFARVNHQAIFLEHCLYIFGGFNSHHRDVTHTSHQLDVFRWNIKTNRWEELKYPLRLKAWDCISKSWRGDPLSSNDGSVQPTHRFGHTVVAWRGRGWLFGGRTQRQLCSTDLYMFDPGSYGRTSSAAQHSSATNTVANLAAQIVQPYWVEVVGLSGSAPSPRDGHSAAVLDDAMFIFGGFDVHSEGYDDQVFRLDFETWSWTRIQIQPLSITATSSFSPVPAPSGLNPPVRDLLEGPPADTTPLARDFASLISHQGRLFMFGGRSAYTNHWDGDIYDSTLWELVPLKVMTQTTGHSDGLHYTQNSFTPAWPSDCSCCTSAMFRRPVAGLQHLRRMVWEAETGNWDSDEFWATCPPRPCCLWRLCSVNPTDWITTQDKNQLSTPASDSRSRWRSGFATWRRLHPGHGLQLSHHLLPVLYSRTVGVRGTYDTGPTGLPNTIAPFGRRSLSHWAYGGYLYVGFGTVLCHTPGQWHLHYNDMWRFNLHTCTWTVVRPDLDDIGAADGVLNHLPSARRRAVACLYIPQPRSLDDHESNSTTLTDRPQVFLFGGTQPRLLRRSTAAARRRSGITGSRRLAPCLARRLSLPQTWERVTQNQLLGLGDETITHQADSLNGPNQITLTAPIAFLFVDPPGSVHSDHSTSLFYLVLVIPYVKPTTSRATLFAPAPPAHSSTPANVCVVEAGEITRLLHAPSLDQVCGRGSIENLFHCVDLDLHCDRLQLHQALRLAWSGVVLACRRYGLPSNDKYNGRRLEFLLVQQPPKPRFSEGHPATTASGVKVSNNKPHLVSGSDPLILELHSYILCDTGTVTRQTPSCTRGTHFWFCLLPTTNHILQNTLNLLEECVKRVQLRYSSKSVSHWLANPIAFRSFASPFRPENVNSVNDPPRSTFVWVDSLPLLAPVDWQLPSSNQICSDADSCSSSTGRSNTVASMLQLFLVHIRLELESELLSKPSKLSADASVEEPTEPLSGALNNQDQPLSSHSQSTHDHVSPEQQNTHAMRKKEEEAEEAFYQFFEDLDNDFVFEPSILLDFESSGSSDSGEADLIHSFHLNGIGLLVQGKESLVELSECYVLHLNTRLYDLCLRRLRGLGPKFLNPLMTQLPNYILHDLKSVYCESVMVNNSNSG